LKRRVNFLFDNFTGVVVMQVILKEKILKLGGIGDVVEVKKGFARNYLLPTKKAVIASSLNVEKVEQEREALEAASAEKKTTASKRADAIKDFHLTLQANVSEEGNLYGSISASEIASGLTEQGLPVEAKEVLLPEGQPIKTLVEAFEIKLQLHSEVETNILVTVSAIENE
jgi:large subunit ribosomal protein L9